MDKEYYPLRVYSYPPVRARICVHFTPIHTLTLVLIGVKNTLYMVENSMLALEARQG